MLRQVRKGDIEMIHIAMARSLSIRDNELTNKQKKAAKRAAVFMDLHTKLMMNNYVKPGMFALRMVSPFHNAVPFIPVL